MTETNKAVATTQSAAVAQQRRTISDLLQGPELKNAVKASLPSHLTPDRFIRVALNATMRNPKLLQCSRESFFKCLLDLSAFGLEADGRRAHLIPFGAECQLIIDYKGLVELIRRSGEVSYIHADVVYEKDGWEFTYGSEAFLKHVPNMEDRGEKVRAVYSFVKFKDGSEDFMVMGRAEVEAVRKRSRSGTSGPWVTDWAEMAKKTCFRRHSKWLPLSATVRDAIEYDDQAVDASSVSQADEWGDPVPTVDPAATEAKTEALAKKIEQQRGVPALAQPRDAEPPF